MCNHASVCLHPFQEYNQPKPHLMRHQSPHSSGCSPVKDDSIHTHLLLFLNVFHLVVVLTPGEHNQLPLLDGIHEVRVCQEIGGMDIDTLMNRFMKSHMQLRTHTYTYSVTYTHTYSVTYTHTHTHTHTHTY